MNALLSPFQVMLALPSEATEIQELLRRSWSEVYENVLEPKAIQKLTGFLHKISALQEQIMDQDFLFLTLRKEHRSPASPSFNPILAVATVSLKDPRRLFLARLYVDPDHQRLGLGSRLLAEIIHRNPQAHCLRLEVEEQNTEASAFYLKNGFQVVALKAEKVEGVVLKIQVMEKILR